MDLWENKSDNKFNFVLFLNLSFIIPLFVVKINAKLWTWTWRGRTPGRSFLSMTCQHLKTFSCQSVDLEWQSPDFSWDPCWFDTEKKFQNKTIGRLRVLQAPHHISAPVFLGDRFDVKIPRVDVEMRHWYPGIVSNHVIVNSLDGFSVCLHPPNLHAASGKFILIISWLVWKLINWMSVGRDQTRN